MGWTFIQKRELDKFAGPGFPELRFLKAEYPNIKFTYQDIDNNVIYAGWELRPNVYLAMVILCDWQKGDFGYKMMDESMEPYYYNVPKSFLDKLSPVAEIYDEGKEYSEYYQKHAQQWRDDCLKHSELIK